MFGRSGQMFPRQRAFHDAIYEEEYGSEQEEDCCQSRGMSAIFCWFLSVIILIGLAASVVLTVFFILKSKNYSPKNGELDLLFDGEQGISFHFPETTTELNSLDFPSSASSSKEFSVPSSTSFEEDDEQTENNNNESGSASSTKSTTTSTTSTRFPPSRKGPSEIYSNEKTSESQPKYQNSYNQADFPRSPSKESLNTNSRPRYSGVGGSEEIISDESSNKHSETHQTEESNSENEKSSILTTSTASTPSQHVLFTSSPDAPVTSATTYRRNLQTTRFPTGRTSFSTSTETLVDPPTHDEHNEDNNDTDEDEKDTNDNEFQATNGHHPPHHLDDDDSPTTLGDSVTAPTTLLESKEREIVVMNKKSEESQLNKMLLDEIPPHNPESPIQENDTSESETSLETSIAPVLSSEFNLPTTISSTQMETTPVDPLARIIKNLAPKWGRNRTIETTTMTSGNYKYDFTISSREKERNRLKETDDNDSKEKHRFKESSSTASTVIVTPEPTINSRPTSDFGIKLGGKRGSTDLPVNILSTIQSPNLSRRQDHNTENAEGENPFLDILVGSEDHKSLITKQTEDGIVTSAILPPWYASTGNSKTTNNSQNITDFQSAHSQNEDSENDNVNNNDDHYYGSNKEDEKQQSGSKSVFGGLMDFFKTMNSGNEENNPKRIVLKRPNGELLAQGSSPISKSSNNNNVNNNNDSHDKKTLNSKDIFRDIASALKSTTILPILDSAVVTDDDILPANNAFHYGTSDGGTNIYGYYPDDDPESDKTVEHQGVQSETLSDEIMENVQRDPTPSHSIELHVSSEGSSEIVIEHDPNNNDHYPRYGEAHAGSEIHGKFVEPPVLHGGGIRRRITPEDEIDLEMKGSENRPVYASNPNAPVSLTNNNVTSNSNREQQFPLDDSKNLSTEMADNSAERDPVPNKQENLSVDEGSYVEEEDEEQAVEPVVSHSKTKVQKEPIRTHHQLPSDSYEADIDNSGSGEVRPVKWSKPDQSIRTESGDHLPPTGSEELKVNPNSGDTNEVMERKPVIQLDEKLYPDSEPDTSGSVGSTENKVQQIYPVGYSTTTTERPTDEPTISEPDTTDDENSSKGFVPPTPVSFHDNKYTFSPPSSDSIYQSKDGWRPLVYNNHDDLNENIPTRPPQWHNRLSSPTGVQVNRPTTSPYSTKPTIPIRHVHEELNEEQLDGELLEDEEEGSEEQVEEEVEPELNKYPWGQREQLLENQQVTNPHAPTKIKFPETSHENSQNYEHPQQNPQHSQPIHQQQQQQQQPIQHQQLIKHNQHQQQQLQQQSNQQPHHHQQQEQHKQVQQPPQAHPNQRQPFQYSNNIDRSKYMMRPAPPPIVMRRAPIQSMPYLPNRGGLQRPQMIPHVQQPNQFINNAPPTEFPHPPPLVNRRRFKNLGPRPRSNINWPTDETRKVDIAERTAG